MQQADLRSIGVVVIGRNEGERLRRCVMALKGLGCPVVYSDSGSDDGSPRVALELGTKVVELSDELPFTAARGRNEGFTRLMQIAPATRYVQFIDGDCEIFPEWLALAQAYLEEHADAAIVCGRLRERFPERSVYNRLCDAEWNRPPGDVLACGGIFMVRANAFEGVGGFRIDIPAGEEPELCHRLRNAGWKIHRLANPMAWHDADMTRFSQWWTRSKRNGFGYAQAFADADHIERHHVRTVASAWIWALLLPLGLLIGASAAHPGVLAGAAMYPVQVIRLAIKVDGPWKCRLERGFFLVLGRWPELLGQLHFALKSTLDEKFRQGNSRHKS